MLRRFLCAVRPWSRFRWRHCAGECEWR